MRYLHADLCPASLATEVDNTRELPLVVVTIEAEAAMSDAASRLDMRRLNNDEARAGNGELSKVHQMPVGGAAIDGAVLTHRRYDDAVRQGQAAQRDRGKEHARHS